MEITGSDVPYSDEWLSVRRDRLLLDGGRVSDFSVVETADCALVVPVDGVRLHLVEQYRHPVGRRCWEFPSGSVGPGDHDPAATAARELREETGLVADDLSLLGDLDTMPSTLAQRCTVFLARGLTQHPARPDPEEQDLRSAWFERSEVERMVREGEVRDGKSVAAYALLLLSAGR